ncbi:MAG TPA: hypothetical protein VHP61_03565 [Acidobacteriota bacterium]|nr:hypothetical protein [Acidobacteriota bacterium]
MKRKSLIVIGLVLIAFSLQSCSSNPEEGLLKKYFNAVRYNDNSTMSSMALEPLTMEISGFDIVSVSPERIEPAVLAALGAKEAELKKKLEEHVGPTIDAKDALDVVKEELDTARTKAAKQAVQKKVDEMQAKYDQEFGLHKELQKGYNDAKAAAAREEEITAFSLGAKNLANIRDLTGDVHAKEVELKVHQKSGGDKSYKLVMRSYSLKEEATGLKHNGRWIIVKFEPLG